MSYDRSGQLNQQDVLRSDLSQLRSSGEGIQSEIDAFADAKGVASACHKSWMHIETCNLFLHDLVLEDNLSSDARAADPLEAMRTYLAGAAAQVKGVMSEEYEIPTAQKRLTMAIALADTTLGLLWSHLDDVANQQRTELDSPGWRR